MLRITILALAIAGLLAVGCSSDNPTEPASNTDTSTNTIHFTVDGHGYTVESLQAATTWSATGLTSFRGTTRPGVVPGAFIGLSFKLTGVGSVHLSNTGNQATDDEFALVLGEDTYATNYPECVNDKFETRYVDLGSVTITTADRQNHRIRGTFSGTLALDGNTEDRCGAFVYKRTDIHVVAGDFDCTWATD